MESRGPKEIAYDEQINPLMAQVIAICKEHKINAFTTFSLDLDADGNTLACTTALPLDDSDRVGLERANACRRIVYRAPSLSGFRITTERGDGSKSVEHVVVAE